MADQPTPESATPEAEAASTTGLRGRIARVLEWASASKLRMGLTGSVFAALFIGIFATWSYLAHLAVDDHQRKTIAMALTALDKNDYEEAKNIVGEMQEQPDAKPDFGEALFVLGAVKAIQADLEWSRDRQRALHLVAARYLQKALELGVPPGRESQAEFLVGKSLIRGNQPLAGIKILNHALKDESLPKTEIHSLLTKAHQSTAEPDLVAALEHNQAVLNDTSFDAKQRNEAFITQADLLGQLGRLEEAHQQLQIAGNDASQKARIKSVSGRLAIARALQLPVGSEQRAALADQAITDLREAQRLDPLSSEMTRQAMYWIGKCYEAKGNPAAAIQQYDQLGKSYGDTPESVAALLAKANLASDAGDSEQALASYRAVLSAAGDPVTYVNQLVPASALRKQLLRAYNVFVNASQFQQAMALVDALQPMFSLMQVTELRAQAHVVWAQSLLDASARAKHSGGAEKNQTLGLYHHRAAGSAYELLAQLRFASRQFTDDLWQAAENYFQGQSYTHAERMLTQYLHHEAKDNQALALLRLGQSQLALGKNASAVETLNECIEMHPGDAVVFQARLECAQAHLQQGQGEAAEELLSTNLYGESLEPTAAEWRDSLFLLGEYLHNSEQYKEAIEKLDEAILRYPNAQQTLLARYTIARSYHSASETPAEFARTAKTESERIKNRKLRDERLSAALENYLQVQRMLTLRGHVDGSELERTLLRNCYMMQGSVLFQLKRYEEARKAYANISTLYQNEPFVLESFVHIANCYRQLGKPVKAKGTIEQAKLILNRLPADTDFKLATNFSRQSWELLLNEMSEW